MAAGGVVGLVRGKAFFALRCAAALLLLTAAGLKAYAFLSQPIGGGGLLESRAVVAGAVELELFLGIWLLSGLYPRLSWAAAVACFGAFTVVTIARALAGAQSCGCFGPVAVNPWLTAALDVAVLFGLTCSRRSVLANVPAAIGWSFQAANWKRCPDVLPRSHYAHRCRSNVLGNHCIPIDAILYLHGGFGGYGIGC